MLNKYSTTDFNQRFDKINSEQKSIGATTANEVRKETLSDPNTYCFPFKKKAIAHLTTITRHCTLLYGVGSTSGLIITIPRNAVKTVPE
ncbi:MAG: hypothetical protein IPO07_10170 [Haliscomenobacter sp.]|nr:hypothetical protein [Haliscomenobacter sp.]